MRGRFVCVDCETLKSWMRFVVSNCFFTFGGVLFHQQVGLPMGDNASVAFANLTLFSLEFKFLLRLVQCYHDAVGPRRKVLRSTIISVTCSTRLVDDRFDVAVDGLDSGSGCTSTTRRTAFILAPFVAWSCRLSWRTSTCLASWSTISTLPSGKTRGLDGWRSAFSTSGASVGARCFSGTTGRSRTWSRGSRARAGTASSRARSSASRGVVAACATLCVRLATSSSGLSSAAATRAAWRLQSSGGS
mmetsp:Transcript_29419/g.103695  ORF Transcript_29419/g.103695 Transcript_29419/m.103695 type:complete len:246 (+) Transcript_29419:252-989(+)